MKKQLEFVTVLSAAALLSAAAPLLGPSMFPVSAAQAAASTGWVEEDGEWRFLESDGYYMRHEWRRRDGDWYYLDGNGYVAKNSRVDEYYVDENGKRLREAWIAIENEEYWSYDAPDEYWYYFGKDERMSVSKWLTIDGKTYYFNEEGHMQNGLTEVDGVKYYFGAEGDGVRKSGWIQLDHEEMDLDWNLDHVWCYFDSRGRMVMDAVDYKIDDSHYTFADGIMQTGWFKLPATATDSNAEAASSSASVKGYQYYEENGKRASGWYQIEGATELSEQGDIHSYYFRNGVPHHAENGIQMFLIDSKRYAFNTLGEMQTDLQTITLEDGTTAKAYLDSEGAARTGRQTIYNEDLAMEQTWFFSTDGSRRGLSVHGIRDNAIYFDGLRQDAHAELRFAPVSFDGVQYLVNTTGVIQKAAASSTSQSRPDLGRGFRDFKDNEGTVWIVNINGMIQ